MNIILKTLVGSRGHKMERLDSDYDYRLVFVTPTEQLLSLGNAGRKTLWEEGEAKIDDDTTGWEIGHFLKLAFQCNPTILEVFGAPVLEDSFHGPNRYGKELRALLPNLIDPKRVFNAFTGYSHNQWKKLDADKYENKGNTQTYEKFGIASTRVLRQGRILLETGVMPIPLPQEELDAVVALSEKIKADKITKGGILDHIDRQRMALWEAYMANEERWVPNQEPVNKFLLEVRKEFFTA